MRCDYCGSKGKCYYWCKCSKCLDPEGYEDWKQNYPNEYEEWLNRKKQEEEYEEEEYYEEDDEW